MRSIDSLFNRSENSEESISNQRTKWNHFWENSKEKTTSRGMVVHSVNVKLYQSRGGGVCLFRKSRFKRWKKSNLLGATAPFPQYRDSWTKIGRQIKSQYMIKKQQWKISYKEKKLRIIECLNTVYTTCG